MNIHDELSNKRSFLSSLESNLQKFCDEGISGFHEDGLVERTKEYITRCRREIKELEAKIPTVKLKTKL